MPQLLDLLREVWRVRRVTVDATGIGEGLAAGLVKALGSVVEPVTFTAPVKSRLGFQLLSMAGSGRLKVYANDGSPE